MSCGCGETIDTFPENNEFCDWCLLVRGSQRCQVCQTSCQPGTLNPCRISATKKICCSTCLVSQNKLAFALKYNAEYILRTMGNCSRCAVAEDLVDLNSDGRCWQCEMAESMLKTFPSIQCFLCHKSLQWSETACELGCNGLKNSKIYCRRCLNAKEQKRLLVEASIQPKKNNASRTESTKNSDEPPPLVQVRKCAGCTAMVFGRDPFCSPRCAFFARKRTVKVVDVKKK
jgi:hypothetical protein